MEFHPAMRLRLERLAGGHVYFINTQKLGADKLLTRKGDSRQHTLWETLAHTAQAIPDRFYVVIDEAHRGMQRTVRKQVLGIKSNEEPDRIFEQEARPK